ncbi:MAG TPA: YhjD/YihY/BrkB family envelope integrity protein, partial [Lacunisphaera sp.]|nr:YhjD/YihY/BrkB family envelope integrity protein [Lacunisphaera sp.]
MPPPPLLTRLRRLWEHDIWAAGPTRERNLKNRGLTLLRIGSITLSGLHELKVAARAAALTYSSLLGLGPLVAILVLISGLALGDRDPAIAANGVNQIITFIAPPVAQYQKVADEQTRGTPAAPGSHATAVPAADPVIVGIINNFITHSRSGTAGVVGVLALLVIVVLLFTSIEKTFNDIWGVRRGRNWITRIIYYWAVITVGAVVFFVSLTLFSAGTLSAVFVDKLPFRQELGPFYQLVLRSSSVLLLVLILTLFYRLVPNTRVKWL